MLKLNLKLKYANGMPLDDKIVAAMATAKRQWRDQVSLEHNGQWVNVSDGAGFERIKRRFLQRVDGDAKL